MTAIASQSARPRGHHEPHPLTFAAVARLRRALPGQPGFRRRGGERGWSMISFGMILLYDKLRR
jgi:hypothetical protein